MSQDAFCEAIKPLNLPSVHYYQTIGSTNGMAMQTLASQTVEDETLFFAEHQTAGRGRFERPWMTVADTALAFSLVLIPTKEEQERLEFFAALGGLAVCECLQKHYAITAKVKYPNDVLLKGEKVAGVLAEANWQAGEASAVVLGIGVNVFAKAVPQKKMLNFPATFVQKHTVQTVQRFNLLSQILASIRALRKTIATEKFIQLWNQNLAFKNQRVTLYAHKERHNGICRGVDHNGNLILENKHGEINTFRVGDVHFKPQNKGATHER